MLLGIHRKTAARARRSGSIFAAIATLLAAGAVGGAEEPRHPRITNGVFTWDHPAVGALLCDMGVDACTSPDLVAPVPSPFIQWCTGTLIGCRTFVTAAHCFCKGSATLCNEIVPRDASRYRVFLQHAGTFEVERITVHPDYTFLSEDGFLGYTDVAVVQLASPVEGVRPAAINTLGKPPFGTPGTIVGFGQSHHTVPDYGLKRDGSVVTGDCEPARRNDEFVCYTFEEPVGPPGTDSDTCFGDSGGPLFVDLGTGPVLAGVTHSGTAGDFCEPPDLAYDPDIFFVRSFLFGESGADYATFCGDVADAGGPNGPVQGFTGRVSLAKPESRHSFDVGPEAEVLRVVLNAADAEGALDFDLYAKLGGPAEPDDFDCALDDDSQYGLCEFEAPTPGTWHVLVSQVAGEGEYQVTVTELPEPTNALLLVTGALVLLGTGRGRAATRS